MRFKLEQSTQQPDWWVLTDTENLVVMKFKEHEYNETQQTSIIDEDLVRQRAEEQRVDLVNYMAHIMSEMGDYMALHHYSVAMPTPVHEYQVDESTGTAYIIRHKYPRFRMEIQDDCSSFEMGNAIKKAGEYVKRLGR